MVKGWFCLKMTLSIWDFTTATPSLMNFLIHGLSRSTTPTPNEHAGHMTVVVASSVSPSVIGGGFWAEIRGCSLAISFCPSSPSVRWSWRAVDDSFFYRLWYEHLAWK